MDCARMACRCTGSCLPVQPAEKTMDGHRSALSRFTGSYEFRTLTHCGFQAIFYGNIVVLGFCRRLCKRTNEAFSHTAGKQQRQKMLTSLRTPLTTEVVLFYIVEHMEWTEASLSTPVHRDIVYGKKKADFLSKYYGTS
jgi:hypothetical protein